MRFNLALQFNAGQRIARLITRINAHHDAALALRSLREYCLMPLVTTRRTRIGNSNTLFLHPGSPGRASDANRFGPGVGCDPLTVDGPSGLRHRSQRPVLVGGAEMPRPQELPAALQRLSLYNAFVLRDSQFHQAVDQLIEAIAQVPLSPAVTTKLRKRSALIAAGLVTLALGGAAWFWTRPTDPAALPGLPEFARAEAYFFGRGVAQNYAEAAKWYLQSAQGGYPSAQNALGRMYEGGQGVSKDVQLARTGFRRPPRKDIPTPRRRWRVSTNKAARTDPTEGNAWQRALDLTRQAG